jgi:NAD+ synthase
MDRIISSNEILKDWAVQPTIERNWDVEIAKRVRFLQETLQNSNRKSLVLGISGGVDSFVAGRLSQLAVEGLRGAGVKASFIALRLPYGTQLDEDAAQKSLVLIRPDITNTVDIKPAVDALHGSVINALNVLIPHGEEVATEAKIDFERGNVKARVRMTVQYEIAALNDGLVVGTDHNAEAVTGFYTKWGDGACDLLPLRGLNKRQVRLLARAMGAGPEIFNKPATADLESLRPQLSDEDALGIPYDVLDDFLEGKQVSDVYLMRIKDQYLKTQHKRLDQPVAMGPYVQITASAL